MIQTVEDDNSGLVDLGDGLLVPAAFSGVVWNETVGDFELAKGLTISIDAEWADDAFEYRITALHLSGRGTVPINGTLLRAVPVQALLKVCVGSMLEAASSVDTWSLRKMKRIGPKPETLSVVARLYTVARVMIEPPTQYVADAFKIPHRTASHWIKLARERGHLVEDRSQPSARVHMESGTAAWYREQGFDPAYFREREPFVDWFAEDLPHDFEPPAGEAWNLQFDADDAAFRAIVRAFGDQSAVSTLV